MLKRIREYIRERKEMRLRMKYLKMCLTLGSAITISDNTWELYKYFKGLPPCARIIPSECDKKLYYKCLKIALKMKSRDFNRFDFGSACKDYENLLECRLTSEDEVYLYDRYPRWQAEEARREAEKKAKAAGDKC